MESNKLIKIPNDRNKQEQEVKNTSDLQLLTVTRKISH